MQLVIFYLDTTVNTAFKLITAVKIDSYITLHTYNMDSYTLDIIFNYATSDFYLYLQLRLVSRWVKATVDRYSNWTENWLKNQICNKGFSSIVPIIIPKCGYRIIPDYLTGYAEAVKILLLDPRVDPSAENNSAIRMASYYGHVGAVKLLLADPRVDPSAGDNRAIRFASRSGCVKMVKLLLEDPRVDPSVSGNYAIKIASEKGHTEVVKLLLEDPRVDPSEGGNRAIVIANENGHIEIVRLLSTNIRASIKS